VYHFSNIAAIQASYHRKRVSGIQITRYSVSQATSSKALLLVTRRHPLNACNGTPYIHSSHGVLGQKEIALDTHYHGGAINQSILPTSKMSADSEISGLTGHFLEQPMPAAPLQIYHRHRISSCTHLSLCWKLKTPLCDLKAHVPRALVSEFGTTQLHIIN
jgi:hypothetical protein